MGNSPLGRRRRRGAGLVNTLNSWPQLLGQLFLVTHVTIIVFGFKPIQLPLESPATSSQRAPYSPRMPSKGRASIDEYQFRLTLIHVERLCHFQALPHQLPCGHRIPCGQGSLCSFTFDRRAFPQRSASINCHLSHHIRGLGYCSPVP